MYLKSINVITGHCNFKRQKKEQNLNAAPLLFIQYQNAI